MSFLKLTLKSATVVFDEIHKYKKWRSLIKGLYDKHHEDHQFIVTGSARLDYFRKGGDSLLGRYRYYRLHPFSAPELNPRCTQQDIHNLLKFGGFPEPFFTQNENEHRIWQRERINRVIQGDLRDFTDDTKMDSAVRFNLLLLFYCSVHLKDKDYGSARTGRVLPFAKFCQEVGLV